MNGINLSKATAVALIVLGCTLLGGVAYEWWPCFSGYTPACANASATSTSATSLLTAWVIALTTSLAGFSGAVHKGRAFVGVVVLLCLNPITDRGTVVIPWDTADTIPFTGAGVALVTLTASIALSKSLHTKPIHTRGLTCRDERYDEDCVSRGYPHRRHHPCRRNAQLLREHDL